MKIYNTLKGKKEELKPIKDNEVNMYACGITPYDDAHLGHAMQAVIFDTLRRYLEYKGYKVNYVRNYTDVDDKIIDRANEQGTDPLELSRRFVKRSKEDLAKLKVREASVEPLVSEHIADIISFIEVLIKRGYAYVSNGSVYYNVAKFKEYGKLSHRTVEDLKPEGDFTDDKLNPNDFALWKAGKEGEIVWKSPWGLGRPGWHIECSTLSQKYLGDSIDIHGGGRDLIFPHHENEIAQSEAKTGKVFANYWMHNGLVTVDKQKMSKSLGNFYSIRDLLNRYTADVIRFLIFSFSYGANLNFNERELLVIDKRLYNFYNTLYKIEYVGAVSGDTLDKLRQASSIFLENFDKYMDDNLSTPRVLAELNKFFSVLQPLTIRFYKKGTEDKELLELVNSTLAPVRSVLGILDENPSEYITSMHSLVLKRLDISKDLLEEKLEARKKARESKDFAKADLYRKELLELGIEVLDEPGGMLSWFQKF